MTCSSKVTISLEACKQIQAKGFIWFCLYCLHRVYIKLQWFKLKAVSSPFSWILWAFYFKSIPEESAITCKPNWILLLDRGQGKSGPHSHLHRQAWRKKWNRSDNVWRSKLLQIKFISSYFCHLHYIGKLRQTGNWDHIMVGFQLVPGEVKMHQNHNVRQHFSETLSWEGDDLT